MRLCFYLPLMCAVALAVIEDLSMSTFVAVDNNMNAIRGAQPAPEAEGDMDSADMLAPSSLPPIANGMDCPALPPTPEQELPEVPTHTPSADPNYSTRRQDKQSAAFKGKEPMPYSYQPGRSVSTPSMEIKLLQWRGSLMDPCFACAPS